jgi:hypothetical protein
VGLRSVIACRHRRHYFERVPHGAQPNGSWREHTRIPAGGRETSRAYAAETGAVKTSVSRHCGADTPLLR